MSDEIRMTQDDHRLVPLSDLAGFSTRGLLVRSAMKTEETCWREYLAPLGIPVLLIADDPDLLATASAAYAEWKSAVALEPTLELRLGLGTTASSDVSCEIDVEGSRLTLTGPGISGYADATAGRATCTVPRRLIGEPAALAAEVTDTLLLFLLTRSGRAPIHAAGIMIGDKAILLVGPSGSGKSSLALAAMDRGLAVLSDDTVYVQTEPHFAVWGFPRPIHIFPEDAPAGDHATRFRGGKLKAAVTLQSAASFLVALDARLVLLDRGDWLDLTAIAADEAVTALAKLEPGFDLLPQESEAAARALVTGDAWRLTLKDDPAAAIGLLCERFG